MLLALPSLPALLLLALAALTGCGAQHNPNVPRASGDRHLLIEVASQADWQPGIAIDSLTRRIDGLNWNTETLAGNPNQFKIWPIPTLAISDARLYQIAQRYAADPWVRNVTPHYADPEFSAPDASDAAADSGVQPHDGPHWYLGPAGINAFAAWQRIRAAGKQPGAGVLVGLPDTGYLEHPELFRRDGSTPLRLDLQRNFVETATPHDARDRCNTWCGLTLNKTYKLAYVGHGTTTASMIISPYERHPDTVGSDFAAGGAPFAELIPLRVAPTVLLSPASMQRLAAAIDYAVAQGAKVIAIAMGGFSEQDADLRRAIQAATQQGVIVVAAAGNGPWGLGLPGLYGVSKPASYPETLAVCGSNASQQIWRDSSNGPAVDICAPAENVRRARAGWVSLTQYVNDTDQSEGTSMAVSLAASVAALWLSYHGYAALLAHYQDAAKIPAAFRQIVATQGHRRPADWPSQRYGAGILDADRVLQAPLPML